MAKDYYVILGVPVDAAPDEIRSAFRRLAREHHPDRTADENPRRFRNISEAYGVLSDPGQRARYDRERRFGRSVQNVPATRRDEPEPLVSEPLPVTGRPQSVRPSYDALLDHLERNFLRPDTPKGLHEEPLGFELILTPREAARGIAVPFHVPVFATCFHCGGLGRHGLFPCLDCRGEGRIVDRETIRIDVPAGVPDGTVIEKSLNRLGIENLWLRVHVRVARN